MAKESKEKEAEWKAIPLERYAEVLEELVHFSFKTTNSNIPAGGIRLGHALSEPNTMPLPYVCVKTLLAAGEELALDYQKNTGNVATVVKQLRMVQQNTVPSAVSLAEREAIADLAVTTGSAAAEFGMNDISPRMRQVLLPKNPYAASDDYVSFSPVGAGGLNAAWNTAIAAHNEQVKAEKTEKERQDKRSLRRLTQAYLPFGGANPQNVGSLVREMQTPLFCAAPQENPEIRKAIALYYKGAKPRISYQIMQNWHRWFVNAKLSNQKETPTNMAIREEEEAFAKAIMQDVLRQGAAHRAHLEKYHKHLPRLGEGDDVSLLSPELEFAIRAWIDPSLRTMEWNSTFATRICQSVTQYRLGSQEFTLGVQEQANAIIQAMREVLL